VALSRDCIGMRGCLFAFAPLARLLVSVREGRAGGYRRGVACRVSIPAEVVLEALDARIAPVPAVVYAPVELGRHARVKTGHVQGAAHVLQPDVSASAREDASSSSVAAGVADVRTQYALNEGLSKLLPYTYASL